MCKVHYNRMRGEKNPATRTGCQHCGIEFEARNDELKRGKGKYCSQGCYQASTHVLICSQCSSSFTRTGLGLGLATPGGQLYCSKQCEKRSPTYRRNRAEMKRRRRARKRGATIEPVTLEYLLQRDRWTCRLCGRRIPEGAKHPHPKSPTVDHVVPLVDGGEHSKANCQAAHYICNSLKSAGGSQQLALIG
jgi:5-methylcytosine-specific restriction endonuclease McrA